MENLGYIHGYLDKNAAGSKGAGAQGLLGLLNGSSNVASTVFQDLLLPAAIVTPPLLGAGAAYLADSAVAPDKDKIKVAQKSLELQELQELMAELQRKKALSIEKNKLEQKGSNERAIKI